MLRPRPRLRQRPVKLVLSREGTSSASSAAARCRNSASPSERTSDGKLTALIHTGTTATPTHARYRRTVHVSCRGISTPRTISSIGQKVVNLDIVANTWMRAPGESMATFALESAIDELAHRAADRSDRAAPDQRAREGPDQGHAIFQPQPRRGLQARRGKVRLGRPRSRAAFAARRQMADRPGRRDGLLPRLRFPATVRVRISADGTALVQAAAQRDGHGHGDGADSARRRSAWACRSTKCRFEYGDSALAGFADQAGGSSQTGEHRCRRSRRRSRNCTASC